MSIESYLESITDRTVIWKSIIDNRPQSNAAAIAFDDYLITIDPSPEKQTAPIFRKDIEEHFKLPVKYLFVTHYHGDHTKGIDAFTDAIVIGSEKLYKKMKADKKENLPDILFTEKLAIKQNELSVEFHHIGGHTACSSYAYFPIEKVIFLGDLLFADEFPWAGDKTSNPDQWIKFLEEIQKTNFDYVVPGHGPLCGKEEISKQLKLLTELRDNTQKALEANANLSGIKKPTIYPLTNESRVTRTMQFFYDYYSKKERM